MGSLGGPPAVPRAEPLDVFAPDARYRTRQITSQIMATLIATAALAGVVILWLILGYVVWRGAAALNWAFFTQRPLPFGQVGGGVGPALLGIVLLLLAASLVGVPVGVGAG